MADKTIGALPQAPILTDGSLFVCEDSGVAKKVTGAQFKAFAKQSVSDYVEAAQSAAQNALEAAQSAQDAVSNVGTAVEDTHANAVASQNAQKGAEDARAAIENMLVEAITLATGQPATVSKSLVDGVVKLVFGLPAGDKGDKGDPGNSIQSIARTSGTGAPGTTDTYTVTLTDGSTTTFQVYNGKDGTGAGDMNMSVYDPHGKATDVFQYVDDALGNKQDAIAGEEGQIVGFDADGKPTAQGDSSCYYAVCSTQASKVIKEISIPNFVLKEGVRIIVVFTSAHTAATLGLNINDTGSIGVAMRGALYPKTAMWYANEAVEFVYTGSNWMMVKGGIASTTYYGLTKLSDSVTSTSTSEAATANAVKQAYDLAAGALPLEGGTLTGTLVLNADPTDDLHAATKAYVDAQITAAIGTALGGSY